MKQLLKLKYDKHTERQSNHIQPNFAVYSYLIHAFMTEDLKLVEILDALLRANSNHVLSEFSAENTKIQKTSEIIYFLKIY